MLCRSASAAVLQRFTRASPCMHVSGCTNNNNYHQPSGASDPEISAPYCMLHPHSARFWPSGRALQGLREKSIEKRTKATWPELLIFTVNCRHKGSQFHGKQRTCTIDNRGWRCANGCNSHLSPRFCVRDGAGGNCPGPDDSGREVISAK